MGKFRPRVKGKGKRWKKGHSSSSNPETNKHREIAKSRFFQENLGESGLTVDAVKKHDAFFGSKQSIADDAESDDGETVGGTFKTFQTFASEWSSCSNQSFSRLLRGFHSDSALHKEMLAVLAAITEVIKANGGKETTTEYFAALMTTLDVTESEESLTAIITLLGMGIKNVPPAVLKSKFSETAKAFVDLLARFSESENAAILRALIGCLSVLLRAQEGAVWSSSSTLQILDSILVFTTHTKPKVRKAAQHAVCAILKGSAIMLTDEPPSHHPAAPHVAKYFIHQIERSGSLGGSTTTLHILTLLKEILGTFPKPQLKVMCETILKVMTLGNLLVTSCGMQALHGLFVSRPSSAILPAQLNAQLISALFDYQPAASDTQPTLAWLTVMQEAYINLGRLDLSLCCANLPRLFTTTTQLWLSDRQEIMSSATLTLRSVTQDCVTPACTEENIHLYRSTLAKLFATVEAGLSYQYHSAWNHVLHLLTTWFQVAGATCNSFMVQCLQTLAELRDSYNFAYVNELEHTIGAALRSMGPEIVLNAIPLQVTGEAKQYDFKRSWLLPVLRENVNSMKLQYFLRHFLPLACLCRTQTVALAAQNDQVGAHSYDLLVSQIWALLPSFCNNPSDLKENFKSIAKLLGTLISEQKEQRLDAMAALRKLISSSLEAGNQENINELSRFAKNYLPILFNVYTTKPQGTDEEGQRLAAFETIKVYLSIANKALCHELYDRAQEKANSSEVDSFVKMSVLDLLRALLPYQDRNRLVQLFSYCKDRLAVTKDHHEQKKAYRLLEELCSNTSESCKEFVNESLPELQELLLKSLSSSAAPSKGPRLRCLSHLVTKLDDPQMGLLEQIIPEAVLCCKDINERCRTTAYSLLVQIGQAMQRWSTKSSEDVVRDYIGLIMAGLAGSPALSSATVLALARIMYEFREYLPGDLVELLLHNICLLMVTRTREIVAAALSFIKVYLTSFPVNTVAPTVPTIVKTLVEMTEDCKRHFRIKTRNLLDRLVRKYGYDAVASLVPETDTITHKRLRNLRKVQARKKRLREQKDEKDSEEEEPFTVKARPKSIEEILADSEESDMEVDTAETKAKNKKKQKKTSRWIEEDEENIVDFTDISAAKKITATRPGSQPSATKPKAKSTPFKTASDGRLIITEHSSDDSDDENRKRHRKDIVNDSDTDIGDDEDSKSTMTQPLTNRKRKLSASTDARSVASSQPAAKYRAGGSGIHRPLKKPTVDTTNTTPGAEYRAKKAKGDVKKKGKPDPYAYLPLSRKVLNRRKKLKNAGQFNSVCRAARKGAIKGAKSKMREGRRRK